jgi:hypothetical protein
MGDLTFEAGRAYGLAHELGGSGAESDVDRNGTARTPWTATRWGGGDAMSRLEQAIKRLDGAIGRLDSALLARVTAAEAREKLIVQLERELDGIRKERAALEANAETVAQRLDATIARLKTAMMA